MKMVLKQMEIRQLPKNLIASNTGREERFVFYSFYYLRKDLTDNVLQYLSIFQNEKKIFI